MRTCFYLVPSIKKQTSLWRPWKYSANFFHSVYKEPSIYQPNILVICLIKTNTLNLKRFMCYDVLSSQKRKQATVLIVDKIINRNVHACENAPSQSSWPRMARIVLEQKNWVTRLGVFSSSLLLYVS